MTNLAKRRTKRWIMIVAGCAIYAILETYAPKIAPFYVGITIGMAAYYIFPTE